MIDTVKLKERYDLSLKEYQAICDRIKALLELEERGLVMRRCDGTLNATKEWLTNRLETQEEVDHCIRFFESHGGYCCCEILLNVFPYFLEMVNEVDA